MVSGGHKQVFNPILFPGLSTDDAPSSPLLLTIFISGRTFNITQVGYSDHHVLFFYQVLNPHLTGEVLDLGFAVVPKFSFDLEEFCFDDIETHFFIAENFL